MKDYIESKIIILVNETKEELIARLLNKIEYRAPQNKETCKAYGGSKKRRGICRPCLTPECGMCKRQRGAAGIRNIDHATLQSVESAISTWIRNGEELGCVGAVDIAVKSYDSASRSSLCLRVQGEELMIHTRLCVISIAIYIYS